MENEIRFDIDPHVVKQLGEQLVSDEVTALMELVKNSYDADASWVSVEINTNGKCDDDNLKYKDHKGYIIVEDDGFGMDKTTILKSWLIISYSNKRELKNKRELTKRGRAPLGEKGLGRLSTQRLANNCEIFTGKENQSFYTHVGFNWKDFDDKDKLGDVPIYFKEIERKKKGTKFQ